MKKILIILSLLAGLFVSILVGIWLSVDLQTVVREMVSSLSKRINGELELVAIEPGVPGKVILRGVKLRKDQKELIDIPEVHVHLSLSDLFQFKTTLKSLVFRNPKVFLEWKDGKWNLADVLRAKSNPSKSPKTLSLVSTDPEASGLSGFKIQKLQIRSADIQISKDQQVIEFRAGMDGRVQQGLLYLDSWIIAMENQSELRGSAKFNLGSLQGKVEQIAGKLQPGDLKSFLKFQKVTQEPVMGAPVQISGFLSLQPQQIVPALEIEIPSITMGDQGSGWNLLKSNWKVQGNTVEGNFEVTTQIGNFKGNTRVNWKEMLGVTEISARLNAPLADQKFEGSLDSKISIKQSPSKQMEINGITNLRDGLLGSRKLERVELATKLNWNPDNQNIHLQRAILDFPKGSGRIEASGNIPSGAPILEKLNLKINARDLRVDRLAPTNLPIPPTILKRLIGKWERGSFHIESGKGTIDKGRFHIEGKVPISLSNQPIKGLRVHLEKVPLDSFDPRLQGFVLDLLDLTPDGRLNSSLFHPSGTKVALGGELRLSPSPIKDIVSLGKFQLDHFKKFLPEYARSLPSGLMIFSLSGENIYSLKGTLGSQSVSIPVTEGIRDVQLGNLRQNFSWNGKNGLLTINNGNASLLDGKLSWNGDLSVQKPQDSALKVRYTSAPLDTALAHFAPLMKSHTDGTLAIFLSNLKLLQDSPGYPVSFEGIASIDKPQYFYHQTIHDLLAGVNQGLNQKLLKGLVKQEISQQAARSRDGVELKNIQNLKFQFDGKSINISPFTIEEIRDEFRFDVESMVLNLPIEKSDDGSVNGIVATSLSADFLKKHLPLKDSFKQSFRRKIHLDGPFTMPLSQQSISSLQKDMISLAISHTDFKEVEKELKTQAKSIEKEAKKAFKDIKSLFKSAPAAESSTASQKDDLKSKIKELKETKEAVKGLFKGLFGK